MNWDRFILEPVIANLPVSVLWSAAALSAAAFAGLITLLACHLYQEIRREPHITECSRVRGCTGFVSLN